jgi:hypothetical protein
VLLHAWLSGDERCVGRLDGHRLDHTAELFADVLVSELGAE